MFHVTLLRAMQTVTDTAAGTACSVCEQQRLLDVHAVTPQLRLSCFLSGGLALEKPTAGLPLAVTAVQAGSALLGCALIKGSSAEAARTIASRTEQLARQAVHADAAVMYMVEPRSKRAISLTSPHGFGGKEEAVNLKESNVAWSAIQGTPWRAVRYPGFLSSRL